MLFGDSVLTFTAGTTVLTQCIPTVLSPDSNIEPSFLLENIFAVNETFLGETSTVTLGQLFAVDASGELIDMEHVLLTLEENCNFLLLIVQAKNPLKNSWEVQGTLSCILSCTCHEVRCRK